MDAYQGFLLSNGGANDPATSSVPNALIVDVFDTFEVFFAFSNIVAGVHSAETREDAENLAKAVFDHLNSGTTP